MSLQNTLLLLAGLLLTVALTGCDSPITQPENEKPLLDIPAHGPDALPGIADPSGDMRSKQKKPPIPPAYELVKQYAEDHPGDPFVAVAGVWNPGKNRYDYQALPLAFSEETIRKAEGEITYYRYRLDGPKQGIIRILAAMIPETPKAETIMNRWLKVKNRKLVEKEQPADSTKAKDNSQQYRTKSDGESNIDIIMTESCWYWYPETGWIMGTCESAVVEAT